MSTKIPYTYCITFKPTGQRYYGVRYAKDCHPDDLWKTYFTSSKEIKRLILLYGVSSFEYEVRRVFNTSVQARDWEAKVLTRLDAHKSSKWINLNKLKAPHGKMETPIWVFDPHSNKERLIELNDLLKYTLLGYQRGRNFVTDSFREKKRKYNKVHGNPMKGKRRPDLSKRNAQPKHWVTNGSQDKLIDRSVLDTFIKDGWIIGRSQQKIKTKECTLRICEKTDCGNIPKKKNRFCSTICANQHNAKYS